MSSPADSLEYEMPSLQDRILDPEDPAALIFRIDGDLDMMKCSSPFGKKARFMPTRRGDQPLGKGREKKKRRESTGPLPDSYYNYN